MRFVAAALLLAAASLLLSQWLPVPGIARPALAIDPLRVSTGLI
jgi:hypothetical protein